MSVAIKIIGFLASLVLMIMVCVYADQSPTMVAVKTISVFNAIFVMSSVIERIIEQG